MLNTMKLALVLALLMLSLGQTLSNLQPVAHQSEYTKDIISPPLKRGLETERVCKTLEIDAASLNGQSLTLLWEVTHGAHRAKYTLKKIERLTECVKGLL